MSSAFDQVQAARSSAVLGTCGLVVNAVKLDLSRLLGVYASFFALVSILCGRFIFKVTIPASTWIGSPSSCAVAWSFTSSI
jgi:hypothetical protein